VYNGVGSARVAAGCGGDEGGASAAAAASTDVAVGWALWGGGARGAAADAAAAAAGAAAAGAMQSCVAESSEASRAGMDERHATSNGRGSEPGGGSDSGRTARIGSMCSS